MTIALCRYCGKAIYSWSTLSLIDGAVDVCWTHFTRTVDGHNAKPKRGLRDDPDRVLLCTRCGNPQVQDAHGWHCESPSCS